MNNEKYILITQVGKQDPWSGWNNKSLDEVKHYGAVLRIIQEKSSLIKKVVLLISAEIEKDSSISIIKDEIHKLNSSIEIIEEYTKIEQAQDYEEIHPVLKPLLIKYQEDQEKYQEDQEKYLINLSSGTPQINTYLHTLFLLGFWKSAFKINVNDPKKDPEHKVIEYDINKKEPIKEFYDASHIATLISRYDYSAALALAQSSPSIEFIDELEFLKDCLNLSLKNEHLKKIEERLSIKEIDSNLITKIMAFWTIQIKFKLQEWQDACVRMAVLAEKLSIESIRESRLKDYVREENNEPKVDLQCFSEQELCKFSEIASNRYKSIFQKPDSNLYRISGENSSILLEFLNHSSSEILQELKPLRALRNAFAHEIKRLESRNIKKLESSFSLLTPLMNSFLPEYKTIWEGENFFDSANHKLLKKADLSWLLKERKIK